MVYAAGNPRGRPGRLCETSRKTRHAYTVIRTTYLTTTTESFVFCSPYSVGTMLRLMNDSIHALPQIFNSLNRLCVRPILPTPFPSLGCQSSLEFDGDVIIIVRFSRTHCFTRGRMEPWRYPSFPPQNVSDMHPLGDHRHSLPPHPPGSSLFREC